MTFEKEQFDWRESLLSPNAAGSGVFQFKPRMTFEPCYTLHKSKQNLWAQL